MDAKVISKAKLLGRHVTAGPAHSGRTLAEMGAHISPRKQAGDIIIRRDVTGGSADPAWSQRELAERGEGLEVVQDERSGTAGKRAHVRGAVLHEIVGRWSGAKEAYCHAYV